MLKILVDIDGVIANMKRYIEPELHKLAYERGIKIQCNNIYYSFSKYIGSELTKLFFDELYDEFIEDGDVYEHAKEVMKELSKFCEIHIVTSRGTGDPKQMLAEQVEKIHKHREGTIKWLMKNGITFDYLVFESDKIKYINENNIDVAIEDQLTTLLDIQNKTKAKPLCFDQTYNKNATYLGIEIVYSWYDILTKLEVLNKNNLNLKDI